MTITVQDHPDEAAYELFDGDKLIGLAQYQRTGNQIAFTHTEVDPAYGNRGLGHQLVQAALDDASRNGWQVLPYCPFVAEFITQNPDYAQLVPAGRRGSFGLE
jgi:predicted GNAT family acetyltransferase